jgi:transposase
MTQDALVVGIDVSKAMLDVAILPLGQVFRLDNAASGWRRLIKRLRGQTIAVVAFEATGGYERGLLKALNVAGLPAARVNPSRIRDFARACGILAKNDRLDALMIARFAQSLPPRLSKPDAAVEALAELVTARRQISEDLTRTANQAEHAASAVLKRMVQRRLRALKADLKLIELEIAKAVAQEPEFVRKNTLLRSAPGVGPVTSCTLLALLPELGQLANRPIAGLIGVAPYDHDSGKLKGQRCIWGGRQAVRDVLYMAALGAIRTKGSTFQAFYQRLIKAGKKPKVAIVAVMRKLATTLNAMLKHDQQWKPA